jgi:hypothetical protein
MVHLMAKATNLSIGNTTMNVSIHGVNSGALVLAKTLPPQFTPQSKYYAIKTIWFCEEIFKRDIQLNKIDTVEQLGDIFTPKVSQELFSNISKRRSWDGSSFHSLIRIRTLNIRFQSQEGVLYQVIFLVLYCWFLGGKCTPGMFYPVL